MQQLRIMTVIKQALDQHEIIAGFVISIHRRRRKRVKRIEGLKNDTTTPAYSLPPTVTAQRSERHRAFKRSNLCRLRWRLPSFKPCGEIQSGAGHRSRQSARRPYALGTILCRTARGLCVPAQTTSSQPRALAWCANLIAPSSRRLPK